MTTAPDADYVARIAPPGSIAGFALLFGGAQSAALGSLLALCAELRESSLGAQDHNVAHARLGWWHEEIERLITGRPVHPITRTLQDTAGAARTDWTPLRGLPQAASIELARATFDTEADLDLYLQAAGGSAHRVCAELALGRPAPAAAFGDALGRALRLCEALDRLHVDARRGFIAIPLAWLDEAGVPVAALHDQRSREALRRVFARLALRAREQLQDAVRIIERPARGCLSGQLVLAAGYTRRLAAWQRLDFELLREPPPQRPLGTLWSAWRAVRRLDLENA